MKFILLLSKNITDANDGYYYLVNLCKAVSCDGNNDVAVRIMNYNYYYYWQINRFVSRKWMVVAIGVLAHLVLPYGVHLTHLGVSL